MYSIKNNPILFPHQTKLLRLFFDSPVGQKFILTGGTALSAFYIGHRHSKDLDFFTIEKFDSLQLDRIIKQIARSMSSKLRAQVRTEQYWELYLENKREGWTQRVDFVQEQPVLFGKRKTVEKIIIDSLENIASNKILTIYGRLEAKDYLDLYFIFKETLLNFYQLFEKTKRKDSGLHEFYFGNIIAGVTDLKQFPQTLKPYKKSELKEFFLELSVELLKRIEPNEKES